MTRSEISPPTITIANGRCESDPMACESAGATAQGCHQHRHHDRAQPEDGAFDRRVRDGVASGAKLVDVFKHDDSGLHGYAETAPGNPHRGDTEVRTRHQERHRPPMRAMATLVRISSAHFTT